ncbi:hypothetical protein AeMF1_011652 [Aphanomyces euteiches]|nr:hypothetical protein AeMF1_011652 [Aphanomyces euteiches]KAH9184179.1 hypothetical protein AeNC1_013844 [Aphanomyces euteiches]
METCGGPGRAFQSFLEAQPGCAIGFCECAALTSVCDVSRSGGLGECTLTESGTALVALRLAIIILLPLTAIFQHVRNTWTSSVWTKLTAWLYGTETTRLSIEKIRVDVTKYRSCVPDTVINVDKSKKLLIETFSRGKMLSLFVFLIFGVLVPVATHPPLSAAETLFALDAVPSESSMYRHLPNSSFPPKWTEYVSVQGDFCIDALPVLGTRILHLSYNLSVSISEQISLVDITNGIFAIECMCDDEICKINPAQSQSGYTPIVYFPWSSSIGALLVLDIHLQTKLTQSNNTREISPTLVMGAHTTPIVTPILQVAPFVLAFLDVVAVLSCYWIVSLSDNEFPERNWILYLVVANVVASKVSLILQLFSIPSSFIHEFKKDLIQAHLGLHLVILFVIVDLQYLPKPRRRHWLAFWFAVALVSCYVVACFVFSKSTILQDGFNLLGTLIAGATLMWTNIDTMHSLSRAPYVRRRYLTARFVLVVSTITLDALVLLVVTTSSTSFTSRTLDVSSGLHDLAAQLLTRVAAWSLMIIFMPVLRQQDNLSEAITINTRMKTTNPSERESGGSSSPSGFSIEAMCVLFNRAGAAATAAGVLAFEDIASIESSYLDGFVVVATVYERAADVHAWVLQSKQLEAVMVVFRWIDTNNQDRNAVKQLKYALCNPEWDMGSSTGKDQVDIGFWISYALIRRSLLTHVREAVEDVSLTASTDVQLYITGFGWGGGLATLAAFDWAGLGYAVSMYSFSAPRIGNSAFAEAFAKRVPMGFRVATEGDDKVNTPKRGLDVIGVDYVHAGRIVILAQHIHDVLIVEPSDVEQNMASGIPFVPGAHSLRSYHERLQTAIDVLVERWKVGEETPLMADSKTPS